MAEPLDSKANHEQETEPQGKKWRGPDAEMQQEWREKLGVPMRFPRSIEVELRNWLVNECPPPRLSLRDKHRVVQIVMTFPAPPPQIAKTSKPLPSGLGINLADMFQEALWEAPANGEGTIWSQLVTVGDAAYAQTWKNVLQVLYCDQFHHPKFDEEFVKIFEGWKASPKRPKGRRRGSEEDNWLIRRFKVLVAECRNLHNVVRAAIEQEKSKAVTEARVLKSVRERLWKQVSRMRGGSYILGGEAFADIPYGRQDVAASCENPETWQPKHLATALLALERRQEYNTIEKRIRRARKARSQVTFKN